MKFAFIHTQLATPEAVQSRWSAVALCRILGVSRSGYAAWKQRQRQPPSAQQQAKQQAEACLRLQIRAAHRRGRGYGRPLGRRSPRVQDELCDQGIWVNLKRVARLMQEEGLRGRSPARRRVSTTDSRHSYRVADNLLERRFSPQEVARPNRFWCGDITYLPTATGWVYLAMVKDLFSRRGDPLGGWGGQSMTAWKQHWWLLRGIVPWKLVVLARVKGRNFTIVTEVANTVVSCFKISWKPRARSPA